jgi:hypothetical protein
VYKIAEKNVRYLYMEGNSEKCVLFEHHSSWLFRYLQYCKLNGYRVVQTRNDWRSLDTDLVTYAKWHYKYVTLVGEYWVNIG